MNKITPLLVITTLLFQAVQAQVKRQYQDEKYTDQTVVIKEEASISDMDILHSQFNLDDIEVGEVIRITTESMPENTAEVIEPIDEKTVITPDAAQEVVTVQEIEKEEEIRPDAKSKSDSSTYSKTDKIKRRKPRFKKQKRKRAKNYKKKCYRF